MTFHKPALSVEDQIKLLVCRGMIISDCERAAHYLSHINYYRLRAYWLPFEQLGSDQEDHRFKNDTNFDVIIDIYNFDRELRLLLLDAIERFEISLRTSLANTLALNYGAFAHEECQHFHKVGSWKSSLDELKKEYQRSRETFAEHFRQQYPTLNTPPIWVSSELMTLGHLSRWLQNIRIPKIRQAIADYYALDEKVLGSFAHHLTIVRNHCAHHGRVWNRKFSLKMQIPGKKPAGLAQAFNPSQEKQVYNTLTMLAYLLGIISPRAQWKHQLIALLNDEQYIDLEYMGFPEDWRERTIWQGTQA